MMRSNRKKVTLQQLAAMCDTPPGTIDRIAGLVKQHYGAPSLSLHEALTHVEADLRLHYSQLRQPACKCGGKCCSVPESSESH